MCHNFFRNPQWNSWINWDFDSSDQKIGSNKERLKNTKQCKVVRKILSKSFLYESENNRAQASFFTLYNAIFSQQHWPFYAQCNGNIETSNHTELKPISLLWSSYDHRFTTDPKILKTIWFSSDFIGNNRIWAPDH